MAALLASITVMLIAMGVAAPTWHYLVDDDREQQFLFDGLQIVKGIQRAKARGLQTTLEAYGPPTGALGGSGGINTIRADYSKAPHLDPITGEAWCVIRQGMPQDLLGCGGPNPAAAVPQTNAGSGGEPVAPSSFPCPSKGVNAAAPIIGVRGSVHKETHRVFWGKNHYDEWCFYIDAGGGAPNTGGAGGGSAVIPNNVWTIEAMTYPKPGVAPPQFTGEDKAYRPHEWPQPPSR